MTFAWEKYIPEMERLWSSMKIIRDAAQLDKTATRVKQHQAVYEKVQKDTGVPWQMVAVIHIREAGENDIGRWTKCLHNGQPWNRKTTIVPRGLGPWSSWHEAAVHAMKHEKLHLYKGWTPGSMLAALEPYNGYGYRNKGLRSPYIWASTNHQQRGKYVSDGVFNPNVMDTQVGCAAQLKYLGVGLPSATVETIKNTILPVGLIAAVTTWGANHPITIGLAVAVLAFGIYKTVQYFSRKK